MKTSHVILGINADHGDASAALFCDGELVAAAEEERFTRVKHAAGFPARAMQYCLKEAGITIDQVDHVAVGRNPWARLGTKLLYAARLPRFAWARAKVIARSADVRQTLAHACEVSPDQVRATIHRIDHHLAHLASSFLVSPFERAAVFSADGLGDFASAMWGSGEDRRLRVQGVVTFPHSIGFLYTAMTQYLGFWEYGDEYKVMGLAAYGEPTYLEEFRRMIAPANGAGIRLGLDYFRHHREGTEMTWATSDEPPRVGRLFSAYLEQRLGPRRQPGESLTPRHQAIAASLQARLEEILLELLNQLARQSGEARLCLAGGVAFNCVANGKVLERTPFRQIYVPPAAGDAGLAIGAALFVHHQVLGQPRRFVMDHASWGPAFREEAIRQALERQGLVAHQWPREQFVGEVAKRLAGGQVVGWFQGRMEWGPRALGNRSILADPRRADMRDVLNERIKRREPFRPFAPSVLEERTGDYFTETHPSPFMSFAYRVRPEKQPEIPAVTHVDGTGRLQTVSRQTNPLFWELISVFAQQTGVPVVLNTSFNEQEPIVRTPEEAIACFQRTRMDALAIGPFLVDGVRPHPPTTPSKGSDPIHACGSSS